MSLDVLPGQPELSRWVGMLAPARQLAEVLADTEFVPRAMRGKPDVVCAAIMYGDELGLGSHASARRARRRGGVSRARRPSSGARSCSVPGTP